MFKKVFSLVLLASVSMASFAYTTYYSKATAVVTPEQVGRGLVYVSTSETAEPAYADSVTTEMRQQNNNASFSYYVYAQPAEGYRFSAWYNDESLTGEPLSSDAEARLVATGATSGTSPEAEYKFYASFVPLSQKYYSMATAHAGQGGQVAISLPGDETVEYSKLLISRSQLEEESMEHTYVFRAQSLDIYQSVFAGWYRDADYADFVSADSVYTHTLLDVSSDSEDPTHVELYAKFVARTVGYQLQNSDFESWNDALNEPTPGWNSFPSATGNLSTMKGQSPYPSRVEGRTGYAVSLVSKRVVTTNANGNLTTGIVNMGSMTPTSSNNHNFSQIYDVAHSQVLASQPDSVELYAKYVMGDGEEHAGNARVLLHDAYNYRDPEVEAELSHRIGDAAVVISACEDWTRFAAAFDYDVEFDEAAPEVFVLVNVSTNATPGGSQKDTLCLDDVRLIYGSELKAVTVGGERYELTDSVLSVEDSYVADQVQLEIDGRAAGVAMSYDAATAQLSVTVTGADCESNPDNQHAYTITFLGSLTGIETLSQSAADTTVEKAWVDGKLLLRRGSVIYDAQGFRCR